MAKKKKVSVFRALRESLREAAEYESGQRIDLRASELAPVPDRMTPRQIRRIRKSLNASQPLFAALLNVSPKAVQSWEQGLRQPRAAALKLLAIAEKNPRVLVQP